MMKISVYIALAFICVFQCYAHERVYSNDEVTQKSGLIIDGFILEKKIVSKDEFLEKYEYKFKILEVLRGQEYVNSDTLLMGQSIIKDGRFEKDFQEGEHVRYFANLGKFEDGEFIPSSKSTDKHMRSFKHSFTLSPNYARAKLFGQPIDVEGKEKLEKRAENVAPKKPVSDTLPAENTDIKQEEKFYLIWLLLCIAIISAIIFLIVRSKIKS